MDTKGELVRNIAIPAERPEDQMDFARNVARVVMDVVTKQGLAHNFGGSKDHLDFEAWSTIANAYNCALGTEWTKIDDKLPKDLFGYVAKAYVKHKLTGEIVATAEAGCSRDENLWRNKPAYQLRSMAQTRAGSKAARMVFSWVAVLAGYSATPAEEMQGVDDKIGDETGQGSPPPAIDYDGPLHKDEPSWMVLKRAKDLGIDSRVFEPYKDPTPRLTRKGKQYFWYKNIPEPLWETGAIPMDEGELDDVDDAPLQTGTIPIEEDNGDGPIEVGSEEYN